MPHLPKAIPSSGLIAWQVGLCLGCVALLVGSLVRTSKPSVQIKTPIAVSSLPHPELSERRTQDNSKRTDYVPSVSIKTQGKHDPRTSVPQIARLLGVRVGYNGQEALERAFGSGLALTGGHPDGRKLWFTRHPSGCIETDGFNINREGLVLESLSWALDPATDPKVPFARRLPRRAGWLGVVSLGMTPIQVSRLTRRLPAPQKSGDVWTWKAKGFVRPDPRYYDIYTTWTAQLAFQNGRLVSIEVNCDGGLSAPEGTEE